MPRGVANAKQLAMMARVLEAYCERFSVPERERDPVALAILILFDQGIREEDALLAAIIKHHSGRAR